MLSLFLVFLAGQILTGWREYNEEALDHGEASTTLREYFATGHFWEATCENWESEFLQMAAFVMLTVVLTQKGSSESRRPGAVELVDLDPRRFAHLPDTPWPVRRGGWILALYERSLGLAFVAMFLVSWAGHAYGGWLDYNETRVAHGHATATLHQYLVSSTFWFESFQNWQSEFLAILMMVWLSVYLRHRGSPESKPVFAPHDETGR